MEQLNVLSHGAGVQTSAMVYMVLAGIIPKPDLIVFADPQWELKDTYSYLDNLVEAVKEAGIPILIESAGNIYEDTMRSAQTGERAPSMPFHTESEGVDGFVSRQCTADYKIDVVKRTARTCTTLPAMREHRHPLLPPKGPSQHRGGRDGMIKFTSKNGEAIWMAPENIERVETSGNGDNRAYVNGHIVNESTEEVVRKILEYKLALEQYRFMLGNGEELPKLLLEELAGLYSFKEEDSK